MKVRLTSTDNPYVTKLGDKHIHLLQLERGLANIGLEVTTIYYDPWSPTEPAKLALEFRT